MDCVWVCVGMHVHVWMRVRAFLFAWFFFLLPLLTSISSMKASHSHQVWSSVFPIPTRISASNFVFKLDQRLFMQRKKDGAKILTSIFYPSPRHTTTIGVVAGFFCSIWNFRPKFRFQTRLTIVYAEEKKNWGPNTDITLWPLSPPHYNHRGVVAGFSCSSRNFGLKFRFQTRLTVLYAEEKERAKNIDINFLTPQPLSPFLTIGVKKNWCQYFCLIFFFTA